MWPDLIVQYRVGHVLKLAKKDATLHIILEPIFEIHSVRVMKSNISALI